MKTRLHLTVRGKVQGVFYRTTAREKAMELGLTGWVRNRPDGSVELVAEGPRDLLDALSRWCRQGPTFARVDQMDVKWEKYLAEFVDFRVTG